MNQENYGYPQTLTPMNKNYSTVDVCPCKLSLSDLTVMHTCEEKSCIAASSQHSTCTCMC